MLKIAPSILSADFSRLGDEVKKVQDLGADMLHIDVMDGHFVPNISIGPMVVRSIRRSTNLPFDVHLMVEEPDLFVAPFVEAGANCITIHTERTYRTYSTVELVKSLKARVGIAVSPLTPLAVLEYILQDVDTVLLMCVEPGFAGQSMMPSLLPKIREARKMIESRGLNIDLAVDGGINENTARKVVKAGANTLIMGSAVFGKKDAREIAAVFQAIRRLDPS